MDMVSFRDIDGDGNEDVIAILSYITGTGPQAAVPFPTTRIFMGDGTKFVIDTELSEAVDEAHANENISTIMDFVKNRTAPVKGEGADKTAEAWWNYRGVVVGNGEIWLNESDGALWIITLNSAEDRTVLYPGETGIQAG